MAFEGKDGSQHVLTIDKIQWAKTKKVHMLSRGRREMNPPRGCAELYSSLPLSPLLFSAGLIKYFKVGFNIHCMKWLKTQDIKRSCFDLLTCGPGGPLLLQHGPDGRGHHGGAHGRAHPRAQRVLRSFSWHVDALEEPLTFNDSMGSLEKGIGTHNTLIQIIKTLGLCCLNSRAISTRQYYYIILLDYYYNWGGETSKPSVSDKSAILLVKPVHLFSSCLLCCLPFWAQASVCLEEKGSVWVLPSVSSI